jgi:Flp pilus assembly protein TadG
VTLPLLLLVSVGIFEFGRAYQTWQIITNAAREGARIAVLPGTNDAAVTAQVRAYMVSGQLPQAPNAAVNVVHNVPLAAGGATATGSRVTVSYPFSFVVLQPVARLVTPGTHVGDALTMSSSALMRNE